MAGTTPWTITDHFRHQLVRDLAATPFSLDPTADIHSTNAFLVAAARFPCNDHHASFAVQTVALDAHIQNLDDAEAVVANAALIACNNE